MLLCDRRPYGTESVAPLLCDALASLALLLTVEKGVTWLPLLMAQLPSKQTIRFLASAQLCYMTLLLSGKPTYRYGE